MSTFAVALPSGSSNGKAVQIAATASPGTTIHTAIAGTTGYDEIYLWAVNTHTAAVELTIEWGGVTGADAIKVGLAAKQGLSLIVPGVRLQNSLVVKGYADVASVVNVLVNVNRITA